MFNPTASLSVRPVQPEDDLLVYALFCTVRGPELEYTHLSHDQKETHLRSQFEAMHRSYAERFPNGEHNIIVHHGEDIGRVYTNITEDEIRLLDIIICLKQRSQGLDSQLIQQMIDHSDATGKAIRFLRMVN